MGSIAIAGYGDQKPKELPIVGKRNILSSSALQRVECGCVCSVLPESGVCGTSPRIRDTNHLFLELPLLEDKLKEYINSMSVAGSWSQNAIQATNAWIKEGLRQRCITRDLKWGVPVPHEKFMDKVQMQGVAVGRAIDLTALEGYDELISELEKMFEIKGEIEARKNWEVVYTDDEGDTMLVGDDPWQEFCKMVKKILICTTEEVKKMNTRCKLPLPSTLESGGAVADRNPGPKCRAEEL